MRAIAIVALAGAAACGSGEDRAETANAPEPGTEADHVAPKTAEGPRTHVREQALTGSEPAEEVELPRRLDFEVLDAGTEPRTQRRYTLAAEEPASFVIRSRVSMRELSGDSWTEAIALPEVRYGLGIHNQAGGGVVHIRGLPAEIDGDGAADAKARALAEQTIARFRHDVERQRAAVTATPRGFIDALELASPRAPDDASTTEHALYQLLLQGLVPLPETPIGVGARWRATMLLYRGAGVVKQTATYELLTIEGARLRVGIELQQIAEHQMVSAPAAPTGAVHELVALFFESKGTVAIDPDVLTPIEGELAVELRVHGRQVAPDGTVEAFSETTGRVILTTK